MNLKMEYWNGQIINPENFRGPNYYISPFSTDSLIEIDEILKGGNAVETDLLDKTFGQHEYTLTGKHAIYKALSFYDLKQEDEVYIVTALKNSYVSSCVTKEIEKFCKWSRTLTNNTKLIFVIHDFGKVSDEIEQLLDLKLPIVEDLAMSMFSDNHDSKIGKYGDFAIYSLPKFFPIQFGGILRYNSDKFLYDNDSSKQPYEENLQKLANHFLSLKDASVKRRMENFQYYSEKLSAIGLQTRLSLSNFEVPSVFMFSSESINLDELKIFMQRNGIESGKFYGENSFFLPIHQNLKTFDLDFIINLIKYFISENK